MNQNHSMFKERIKMFVFGGAAILALLIYLVVSSVIYGNDATSKKIVETYGADMNKIIEGIPGSTGRDAIASSVWLSTVDDGNLPWTYLAALYAAKSGSKQLFARQYLTAALKARIDAERCGTEDPQAPVVRFEMSSEIAKGMSTLLLDDPKRFSATILDGLEFAMDAEDKTYKKRGIASWICPRFSPMLSNEQWFEKRDGVRKSFHKHWTKVAEAGVEAIKNNQNH